ncbi:MAG TPA: hypothetical protein VMG12_27340 [Polyangiaceae bacterium]|nr:hypothetical protein [Polyangiaceae bacterium]
MASSALVGSLAAPLVGGCFVLGCSQSNPGQSSAGQSSAGQSSAQDGVEGTLVAYTARFDDGTSDTQYALRIGDEERPLVFAEPPSVAVGGTVRVWGASSERGIEVERIAPVSPSSGIGRLEQAQIGADPFPARRFALALVDIGGGVNINADQAATTLFGADPGQGSVRNYFREVSYGRQDIDGEIFGPFQYNMNGCDTRGLVNAIRPQIPGQFDHYLWYIGSRTQACGWAGLASVGTPDNPSRDTWYNAAFGCVVLVQEPGHNLGGQHSSHINCGDQIFVDEPDGVCTHDEYGDPFDPLGGGCDHTNAYQKAYQEWLTGCNGVRANSTGRFTLFPLEKACNGAQVLQVPMPRARLFSRDGGGGQPTIESLEYYYLELRTERGFDADMPRLPTVLVHVAENWRDPNLDGRHTWILDMNPQTNPMDGMTDGQSFTDPAGGVRFEVVELSHDKAVIQVDIENGTGAPTCLDGRPMLVPGPSTCEGEPERDVSIGGGQPGGGNNSVAVVSFTLIDADTDQPLFEITDGTVLNLDALPPNLNVRADTVPPQVGSVGYEYQGDIGRTENIAPYSLGGDDGTGDFAAMDLELGEHVVTATAYEGQNGSGVRGGSTTVRFTVARLGAEPPPPDAGAGGTSGERPVDLPGDAPSTPDAGAPVPTDDVPPVDETTMVDTTTPEPAPDAPPVAVAPPVSAASSDESGCALGAPGSSQQGGLFASASLLAGALLFGRRRSQRAAGRASR